MQRTGDQELHGEVLWVCNSLSFLGSLADPGAALLGLCHLETVQGGSEQGGGKVAEGYCGRVCVWLNIQTHTRLCQASISAPPPPPTGPAPTLSGQPSGKGSLVGSYPFPQVQALRSVTSHPSLGVSCFVCFHYLWPEVYLFWDLSF